MSVYHRCCSQSEHDGAGYERCERRIELSADVGAVAKLTQHQRPFASDGLNHPGGDEHAGQDYGCVERR